MKKIAGLIGAGALLLSAAVPALAAWNWANITTTTKTSASSGDVSQTAVLGSNYGFVLGSGAALSGSTVATVANTNVCSGPTVNAALVNTSTSTSAASGDVSQFTLWGSNKGAFMTSGGAGAGSEVFTVVNTNFF